MQFYVFLKVNAFVMQRLEDDSVKGGFMTRIGSARYDGNRAANLTDPQEAHEHPTRL